jgi:hypothetical protein
MVLKLSLLSLSVITDAVRDPRVRLLYNLLQLLWLGD